MKLIIPMAGRGTRVRPHSHTIPKPLLPVAGTMIIERITETFSRTLDRKIDEIVFILGPDFGKEIKDKLADMCRRHNTGYTFRVQDKAMGTAHAVYCAEQDLDGEVIIAFADTLFDSSSRVSVEGSDCVIWLKEVEDPSRFGVAVHTGDKITGFVEKPETPVSNLAIIGVYYFRQGSDLKQAISWLIEKNITGHGGEFQLTDALDKLLKDGSLFKKATVDEWLDCGTLSAWMETTGTILEKENHDSSGADISNSKIIPPVFFGEGVTIRNSTVGPHVSIESGSRIDESNIRKSIIQEKSRISRCSLNESTIGNHVDLEGHSGTVHLGDHSIVTNKA